LCSQWANSKAVAFVRIDGATRGRFGCKPVKTFLKVTEGVKIVSSFSPCSVGKAVM